MEKIKHLNNVNDQLEAKWNQIKSSFMLEYSCLSSEDLQFTKGEFDKLLKHIGDKTGMSAERIRRKIMRWDDAWLHFF